jgi:hypothetical protein
MWTTSCFPGESHIGVRDHFLGNGGGNGGEKPKGISDLGYHTGSIISRMGNLRQATSLVTSDSLSA